LVVPGIVADAGEHATRRFLEYFAANIRNRNTRMAYMTAVGRFFAWCDRHRVGGLVDIEPQHIADYIEELQVGFEKPTVKQHLAAIRKLLDWLVIGHVIAVNPATSVRGPKHAVKRGKTTVLTAAEARTLLDSIPITRMVALADGTAGEDPDLVGLRDRAVISVMTYAFGRISAVLGMRVEVLSAGQALVGAPP
jgi:site-specific recombinase XerD